MGGRTVLAREGGGGRKGGPKKAGVGAALPAVFTQGGLNNLQERRGMGQKNLGRAPDGAGGGRLKNGSKGH